MTRGYCARRYRCGIEESRMEEPVVTVTNFPARIGVNTESNGSAL
jgi:hypothetical protein